MANRTSRPRKPARVTKAAEAVLRQRTDDPNQMVGFVGHFAEPEKPTGMKPDDWRDVRVWAASNWRLVRDVLASHHVSVLIDVMRSTNAAMPKYIREYRYRVARTVAREPVFVFARQAELLRHSDALLHLVEYAAAGGEASGLPGHFCGQEAAKRQIEYEDSDDE
jgi:hypothetical protein